MKGVSIRAIIVADHVGRHRIPRECFDDLLRQPLRRRVAGHRKPEQLAPAVADHKERKQTLECRCRNYAEINRRDGMRVIVQQRPPAL